MSTKNIFETPGQKQTNKDFFLVFRFYGPMEGYIEKSWVLDDLELLA
jgi:hypothetical protein